MASCFLSAFCNKTNSFQREKRDGLTKFDDDLSPPHYPSCLVFPLAIFFLFLFLFCTYIMRSWPVGYSSFVLLLYLRKLNLKEKKKKTLFLVFVFN